MLTGKTSLHGLRVTGLLCMGVWCASPLAQEPVLEEITVYSTRIENSIYDLPSAVSIIEKDAIQLGRQQLGIDESLARVPGIFMMNRYNFTQDIRIAMRGFGSRANFGIRGIKVFSDEFPATLADGQSGIDDVDLGSTERIEVIRGPSSSLYGTASGGVISLVTEDGPETPFAEGSVTQGSYDHEKYQFKAGGQHDQLNYLVNVSHMTMDGYREHSEVEHTLLNSKFRYDFDTTSDLTVIFNVVDSPLANDAGGVTAANIAANRKAAQPRNTSSRAGESMEQYKLGLVYHKEFSDEHKITLRNYYLWRDFQTFLPIGSHIPFVPDDGVVEFDRFFYGGGLQYNYSGDLFNRPNEFTMGFDIDIQEDDRQRFINNAGVKGALSFDQLEEAESYGFYFRNEIALLDNVTFVLGGRYDIIDLSVDDRYLVNADQSGQIEFDEFNATVGLLWNVNEHMNVYANYGTSFETPTFTELANPAQDLNVNLGGFANVTAQTATSYEIGIKGNLLEDRIYYDLAAYTMDVEDEITNVVAIANRAFFENADTDRQGFEASIIVSIIDGLEFTSAYTYSDFTFDRFQNSPALVGNDLPGIPEHLLFLELAYRHDSGFFLIGDIQLVDEFYANNANTDINDSYTVANLRAGFQAGLNGWNISPYIGVNNLFDEEYNSNIRINAVGGRYFEPAPEIHLYGGVNVRYNF